jgi:hypothetical protein
MSQFPNQPLGIYETGGVKQQSFDWSSLSVPNLSMGMPNTTSTPVLCKDGTYDYETNSPNARIDNSKTCINKGGRAETFFKVVCNDGTTQMVSNQPKEGVSNLACTKNGGISKNQQVVNATSPSLPTKSGVSIFTKLAGAYNKNLIIAGVLVAGYFAYKKFKK